MSEPLRAAVDLGAGSGRVFLAGLGPGELRLEEVARFRYPPREQGGHLRWDAAAILQAIDGGLRSAAEAARSLGRRIATVGVDSWGVDYGLVDERGWLVEDPICYRDGRTAGVPRRVFARVSREEIFARTGIQVLDFNTLYQVQAHVSEGIPPRARRLLLIPDLVNLHLTGRMVTEHTNATTTQLVRAGTQEWDRELMEKLGLPAHLFGEIVPAGSDLGLLSLDRAISLGLTGTRVVAPATHDTGSAVAGTPLADGWAYISSGTWSLVGVERAAPVLDAAAARANFTNEGGAFGTTRLLKNVMGLWILERCRQEWEEEGRDVGYARLIAEAAALDRAPALLFPDDPRLLSPARMTDAIAAQLAETSQAVPSSPAALARVILDSLALRYASVLAVLEKLTGSAIVGIRIVGGGGQNDYLNQATADATGRVVVAGPVEATVLGNALVQAVADGRFATLAEARGYAAERLESRRFEPRPSRAGDDAARRYADVEERYAPAATR